MEDTLPLQDVELMVQWCTATYRSMARDHAAEALWQTAIPQLSLQFSPLRHGLLALSALHVARTSTSPKRKWRFLVSAREHQSQALRGVHLEGTSNPTDSQCNANFALCCVLLVFSFAYCLIDDVEAESDDQPNTLDEFLEVFQLTRWLVGAMMLNMNRIVAGELYPLVRPGEARPRMPNMSRLVVLSLRRQNEIEARQHATHETEVYNQAIEHLSISLEQLINGCEPKDYAFCWIYRVPARFVELVCEREPFALVLLAHYVVILHHLKDSWWMGDWGTRIFKVIVECLEPEWHQLISWPADAMGYFLPEA